MSKFFLFSLLAFFSPAFAVEVEPVRLELTIPPDQPTQANLQVTNHSSKAVQVRLSADQYRSFDPNLHLPSAQAWLHFEPDNFTLAAGVTSRVRLEITPPDNLLADSAGEYLAAILVDELPLNESTAEKQESRSTITVVPRFAMPVYLEIEGRQLRQIQVQQVSVRGDPASKSVLQVATTLLNPGTVHVRPTGTIGLFLKSGGLSQAHPLGKSVPLLPGASLSIPTLIPMPPPGQYKAVVTVSATNIGGSANLSGGDVGEGKLLQKEVSFEITPEGEVLS